MAKGPYRFDLAQFYAELQKQSDIGSCASLFKRTVAHFGFDTFACGEVDTAHRDRNVFFIIEWPERWRRFYIGSGLIERDPLLGALSARRKSFTWSELRKVPSGMRLEFGVAHSPVT